MKVTKLFVLVAVVLMIGAVPALAQNAFQVKGNETQRVSGVPQTPVLSGASLGAGLGMALSVIGAGWGMGRIGSAALESMARQPEVAPRIQTAMIIIAAMLEGATLASIILCYLVGGAATF
jgi:F-type H+-transporting ATPase subunit c